MVKLRLSTPVRLDGNGDHFDDGRVKEGQEEGTGIVVMPDVFRDLFPDQRAPPPKPPVFHEAAIWTGARFVGPPEHVPDGGTGLGVVEFCWGGHTALHDQHRAPAQRQRETAEHRQPSAPMTLGALHGDALACT